MENHLDILQTLVNKQSISLPVIVLFTLIKRISNIMYRKYFFKFIRTLFYLIFKRNRKLKKKKKKKFIY
jgi:hypothetical protein